MLNLNWIRCGNGQNWCDFQRVNLADVDTIGVYIVWYEGDPSRVVRVGQGDIADRIRDHRSNTEITDYAQVGELKVTWAAVDRRYLDGVERFLADFWKPLVGYAFPVVDPITVNSPFENK